MGFLLADLALPIIRANFLQHFGLLVDLGEMQILACRGGWSQQLVQSSGNGMFATIGVVADQPPQVSAGKKHQHEGVVHPSHSLPTGDAPTSPSLPTVEAPSNSPSLQHMLGKFPNVLSKSKVLPKPTHRMQHFLVTEGHPVTARHRWLDNERLEAAKKEFAELEKQGIIRRSSSN